MNAYISYRENSKVILEEYDFGVYALFFLQADDTISTRDDLYENVDEAKRFCLIDYGVPVDSWSPIRAHIPIMKSSSE
jgi:hypothetical protein